MSETKESGKTFQIAVTINRNYCGEVLQAIVSTILFMRLFGSLTPTSSEAVGITFPRIADDDIDSLVTRKVREVTQSLNRSNHLEVRVEFYERRVKKTAWFAKTHNFCWESWRLHFTLQNGQPTTTAGGEKPNKTAQTGSSAGNTASGALQRALMEVISIADNNKEHIPPITTRDVAPFPYEIFTV